MGLLGSDTRVTGPFPEGVLLLETLAGTEELGVPYDFEVGLLSRNPNLDPELVVGHPLTASLRAPFAEWRDFHGIVISFAKVGITGVHTRYRARLRPQLATFAEAADCRVFNEPGQNVLTIVTRVLGERGLSDVDGSAVKDHPFRARELCVQHRESDLCFVQRLLEEEGIYYFFRQDPAGQTLVLANANTAHQAAPGYETVPYTPNERGVVGGPQHFWGMEVHKTLYPGRHTVLAGYDPTRLRPRQPRFAEMHSDEPAPGRQFEHYDYPGGLFDPDEADGESMLRSQAERVSNTILEVEGNTVGLGIGNVVRLRPGLDQAMPPFWRAADLAKQYLVVRATYSLSIDEYETGTVAGSEPFKARYWLLDTQIPFRPQRTVRKPVMAGPQTAVVVGRAGDEIWTDALGRVRVQFDWDRLGKHDENATCWLRVTEPWAAGRWGASFLPRVGQEVLVRFLDGDPDRPIVTGALYNADNPPPYELPAHATQSGIKSRSSQGGAASSFNEIRFEDAKGAEELHVQAERDMSTLVKHCQSLRVGQDRGIVVGQDEHNLVRANRELTVDGKDSVVVGGNHDKTVSGAVLQVYGGHHSRRVGGEQELVVERNKDEHVRQTHMLDTDQKFQLNQGATSLTFRSQNVTLDAAGDIAVLAGGATVSIDRAGLTTFESPAGITLTCGASSLTITPGGVALAAPAITAAAAGGGSVLVLGAEQAGVKSRKVTIEASGVCRVWGHKALKLQEADKVKGGKGGAGGNGPASLAGPVAYDEQLRLIDQSTGKPLADCPYVILRDEQVVARGRTDKDGMTVRVSSGGAEAEILLIYGDDAIAWD